MLIQLLLWEAAMPVFMDFKWLKNLAVNLQNAVGVLPVGLPGELIPPPIEER